MTEPTAIALFVAATAFALQLLATVYGYGKLQERVGNIITRLDRLERQENGAGKKYTMSA